MKTISGIFFPVPKMIEGYGKANHCSLWDAILAFK